jgi:hypothetical protein
MNTGNTIIMNFHSLKSLCAAALLLSASAITTAPVLAHGAAPARHGGVVQSANDMSFELASADDGAVVYVVDHDNDRDASKMSGKLTVLNGVDKSEAELKPAGGNKLQAKGIKLGKGAKAVATVTEGRKTTTVRFTIK